MYIIETHDFMTYWKMRISINKLHHPHFIILEACIAVIEILVNVTFQFVHKLLFIKAVNFFRHKDFVMTKSSNYAMFQCETFKTPPHFM